MQGFTEQQIEERRMMRRVSKMIFRQSLGRGLAPYASAEDEEHARQRVRRWARANMLEGGKLKHRAPRHIAEKAQLLNTTSTAT